MVIHIAQINFEVNTRCILKKYKHFLRRLLGVRTEGDKKGAKVQKLAKNEVNIHPTLHCFSSSYVSYLRY